MNFVYKITMRITGLMMIFFSATIFSAPLTLKESIQYAIEHSPALSQSIQNETLSDLELSNRRSQFFPRLDLESQHGIEKQHSGETNTDPWLSKYQLTLSQKLYDNHESITKYSQGKLENEISKLKVLKEKNNLTYQVIRLYNDYSKNRQRLEARKDQFDILKKQYENVSNQYRQGLKMRKDFLRLKSQLQTAEINLRQSTNEVERVRLDLQKTLGAAPTETIEFSTYEPSQKEIPASTPSLENSFEYQISKMEKETKQYDTDLAQRKYWPEIKLTSSAFYGANSYINQKQNYGSLENYGGNILLSLNYAFWDWGTQKRELEKARVNESFAENEFKKTTLNTNQEIKSLMLDLSNLKANLILTEELYSNQENTFKILEREYRDGQSTYTDYINGLNEKLEAKVLYWDTRYELATSLAKFRYFEGKLYADTIAH